MRRERQSSRQPYKLLGLHLKDVRQKANQTVAEVSGAVEVEQEFIESIERGEDRPSEEILLLLISHFDIEDEEATGLWEMAGYTDDEQLDLDQDTIKAFASILAPDLRIIYTDMIHVTSNENGLTMNFMQSGGPNGQPMVVSRLGMSKDQAKNVMAALKEGIEKPAGDKRAKFLPSPKDKTNQD